MRIALGVEYDGAGFHGWQSQPDRLTVQDALEAALARVAGEPVRVHCAGRTDAGVHACGQVVHFDTLADRPASAWVRGTNAGLPATVAVQWAQPVPAAFHARFSALSRSYTYLLCNEPVRPALGAGRVGWFHLPLDETRMQAAAQLLVGSHDFSAFRAAECQARSPVKSLHCAEVSREGRYLVLRFRADAFLHHMVRNLVGALVYVGKGRQPVEWVGELLAARQRSRAAPTFSAAGLYLSEVEYDPVWRLPAGRRIIAPLFQPAN